MSCDKRPFGSKQQAHQAVQTMSQRVRVYVCPECRKYHVTKDRDGNAARDARAWASKKRREKRRGRMDDRYE